jgi:spermidine synthase
VVLFMGVTNDLCLDVASIPFLWILPLAIYLISFIVCFGSERLYRRGVFAILTLLSVGLLVWARAGNVDALSLGAGASPIAILAILYLLALFFGCMLVHGELYKLRPSPDRLTEYYLCVSGGGALGGLFVAIAAPRIFSEYYELPFGWLACLLLSTAACLNNPGPLLKRHGLRPAVAGAVGLAAVIVGVLGVRVIDAQFDITRNRSNDAILIYQTRNFFSIMRVMDVLPDDSQLHHTVLKHGTTSHGAQFHRPDLRRIPVSYFGIYTGIGMLMHERTETPMHVGIIGLGAGTLAAYGREGDRYQFYEIDQDVVRIARDAGYFSYLEDSRASVEIVLGDGRLSLERQLREAGPAGFDLLIMDAFSSDAVPVHLITLEALQLYVRHLKPDGVLAVHISNVNLALAPLVFRLAAELGMDSVRISNMPFPRRLQSSSDWMILSHDSAYLSSFSQTAELVRDILKVKPEALTVHYLEEQDTADAPLWTDDYSDLLSVLKMPKLNSWRDWKRFWGSPRSTSENGPS